MKLLIITLLLTLTIKASGQLKDPLQVRVSTCFSDTVQATTLQQLKAFYERKGARSVSLLSPTVLAIYYPNFFIVAVVRSKHIQLKYCPNDDLCSQ